MCSYAGGQGWEGGSVHWAGHDQREEGNGQGHSTIRRAAGLPVCTVDTGSLPPCGWYALGCSMIRTISMQELGGEPTSPQQLL